MALIIGRNARIKVNGRPVGSMFSGKWYYEINFGAKPFHHKPPTGFDAMDGTINMEKGTDGKWRKQNGDRRFDTEDRSVSDRFESGAVRQHNLLIQ